MPVTRPLRGLLMVAAAIAVIALALESGSPASDAHAASTARPALEVAAPEQAQPACPDAVGGLGITPFQQRSGNLTSSQSLGCTYVAPVGTVGQARLLLRWNDPAATTSRQCHSATNLREQRTTNSGNGAVTLWSAARQIQVEAIIVQAGPAAEIGAAEAAATAWLAANESIALPCAPEPQPVQAGSLACPLRIDDLVWLGFYSSGDIGNPEPRQVGGATIPGFLLACDYRTAYDDVEGRGGFDVIWVEPDGEPPRVEECTNFGRDRTTYSATRAAWGQYDDPARYQGVASEASVREAMLAVFAAAEAQAATCPQAATVTPTEAPAVTGTAAATAAAESCAPFGVVTDHLGEPMVGLRVQLHLVGEVVDQRVTDDSGAFQFEDIAFFAESYDFDLADDEYEVGAVLRDAVEGAARFQIHYGDAAVLPDLRTQGRSIEDDPSCESNIAFANVTDEDYRVELGPATPTEWRSLAFSYQHLRIAWNFATETLGVTMDHQLPLRLYSYCNGHPDLWWGIASCGSRAASYLNATSHDTLQEGPPLIQFNRGFSSSRLSGSDRPINGEYHEFGHAVMGDAFGNLMPGRPDHQNHRGYANPSSTDSWTEGFAEWFALMVQREHVGGQWWLYTVGGRHSLEDDRQVTGNGGKDEELSIAGILVDMVDGPADYTTPITRRLTLLEAGFVDHPTDDTKILYGAQFRNDTPEEQTNVAFRIETGGIGGFFTDRRTTFADPSTVAPGEVAVVVAELPASITPGDVQNVRVTGLAAGDDDNVSHSAREVWDAIVNFRGSGEHGNGFVVDVSELYEALIGGFPDEADAIDQIFINHGWYADAGETANGQFDPGEAIGVTSPDGIRLRTAPVRAAVFDAHLDTGTVASTAFVQVLYPEPREALSYAFEAPVDEETGTIALAVPPAETGAVVRIVLRADGHFPVILDDIEAATFWADAESAGFEPFMTLGATMVEGALFEETSDDSTIATPVAVGAAAGAIILVVLALVFGERAIRRRSGSTG